MYFRFEFKFSRARRELDSLREDDDSGDDGRVDEAVDAGLSQSSLAQQSASFNADFLLMLRERSRAAGLLEPPVIIIIPLLLSNDDRVFFSDLMTSSEVDDDMFLLLFDGACCSM